MATNPPSEEQVGGEYGSAAAADGWRRTAEARSQVLGPITEMMLDWAGVGPGSRVLDVAAGTGEQTLLAAQRVGPTGSVLATDIAASMLAVARTAAKEAGLSNVETREMDARDLDLEPDSLDAAISRLALMLIPQRDEALLGIRRALKPGGRLAVVVYSSAEKNAFNALPLQIVRRRAGLPLQPSEDPGLFALADPGTLRVAYQQAGFRDVAIHVVPALRRFSSVATAVQYRLESMCPEVAQLLGDLSDDDRDAARAEIEEVVRPFAGPGGVDVPSEFLIGVGAK